jgi:predicted DCC family thiol-disulfide oxidoreductase YuxK
VSPTLVLFDEGCGLCARFADALASRGVRVAGIGSPAGDHWLRDLSRPDRYRAFHAVDAEGRRRSGGDAVPVVLEALGRRSLARLVRSTPVVGRAAYAAVARSRGPLGRVLGSDRCRAGAALRRASRARAG